MTHHYGVNHHYRAETRHDAIGKAAIAGRILGDGPWHEDVEPIPRDDQDRYDYRTYVGSHWQTVHSGIGEDLVKFLAGSAGENILCDVCGEDVHYYWDEPRITWVRIGDEVVCAECIVRLLEELPIPNPNHN